MGGKAGVSLVVVSFAPQAFRQHYAQASHKTQQHTTGGHTGIAMYTKNVRIVIWCLVIGLQFL